MLKISHDPEQDVEKMKRTLRNQTDIVSKTLLGDIANLVSVDEDPSTCSLIEAIKQPHCKTNISVHSVCQASDRDKATY